MLTNTLNEYHALLRQALLTIMIVRDRLKAQQKKSLTNAATKCCEVI